MKLKYLAHGKGNQYYACDKGRWTLAATVVEDKQLQWDARYTPPKTPIRPTQIVGNHPSMGKMQLPGGLIHIERKHHAPDPNHKSLDWVQLDVLGYSMLKRIYRTHTSGGIPSRPTCNPSDQPMAVEFSATVRFKYPFIF
ncbi:hypothetical protein PTTG_26659 [Puccinia triticina 1-1 BBBD Race 1]|uniref:Uncharacterized protein n=2 Tax=Puccinia triticina TaxID=208348 RepID=A0A180GRC2_PUCT1|nr:hypothetical protein PTTG_26659 [Puccinia triticina 1-1 BBBD Race 1]